MAYWCAAQIQPQREKMAIHWLRDLLKFDVYAPRLRDRQTIRGCKITKSPLFFPAYCFVRINLQWSAAQYCPGVARLVMDGTRPARVPDSFVNGLKAREVGGLIELPKEPRFHRGEHVRIRRGPFADKVGLVIGLRPHERVAVLLSMFGRSSQIELAETAAEPWPGPDRVRQQNPRQRGIVR